MRQGKEETINMYDREGKRRLDSFSVVQGVETTGAGRRAKN